MAITRVGLAGPMTAYGTFSAKAESGAGSTERSRRGKPGRGRARKRGRSFATLWWLALMLGQGWMR